MTAFFELVTAEFGKPAAAIFRSEPALADFYFVNGLLPEDVVNQPELAVRWNAHIVLSTNQWASEHLRRRPMFKPATTLLQIVTTYDRKKIQNPNPTQPARRAQRGH